MRFLSMKNFEQNYFKCNWNKTFFLCGLLILFSSISHSLFLNHSYKDLLDPNLSFIGTLNWLPFFWLFWGFQPYLNSKQKRQFRRQQRRVIALEAEVDDFFQSRYQEELKKLLSGQMDTTPNIGLRVPYEIQSRNCDGIPEGFIPQNNF